MKSFGNRNYTLDYWKREGAYAIIQNKDKQFLCVEDLEGNLYLVGGGIEEGESPKESIIREGIEEIGYQIEILKNIGQAEKHWVSEKYSKYSQHNIANLYQCKLLEKISEPIENEKMKWVDYDTLEKFLFHEHHLYLINLFLSNEKNKEK